MTEQEFVAEEFQKAFEQFQGDPFVLYGLGKNTEAVLTKTRGFSFVGLMDAQNVGTTMWNLEVLSLEKVATIRPRIVIIARESVVPIIYERIAQFTEENDLKVYNFKGEPLGRESWTYKNTDLPYWNVSESDLIKEIDCHDCISFDIFDTLIMRKVLEPKDVFEIAERRIRKAEQRWASVPFAKWRKEVEHALPGYPTFQQIYDNIGIRYDVDCEALRKWADIELMIEEEVLVPRKKMVELFFYAVKSGKRVSLLSDMYFPGQEMKRLLDRCGIKGYGQLLISCECNVGKEDGLLYDLYKEQVAGESYLHIGDNRRSDGVKAREHGIDSFCIYSGYEMWMASSMQRTLSNITSLEQRCILGNIIWKSCESPFELQKSRGMFLVDSPEKLGYVFAGGIYDTFANWLIEQATKRKIDTLLLPARDGFLIQKLLEMQSQLPFEYLYFRASRRAVSVASLLCVEDIMMLAKRNFQGSLGELLSHRFGVGASNEDEMAALSAANAPEELRLEFVRKYEKEILENAKKERKDFLAYLRTVLPTGQKLALVDFVATGTVQFYLQKLLGCEMKGLYFATMNHPKAEYGLRDSVVSCYGNIHSYGVDNEVGKHYLFLETLMGDGYPTLERVYGEEFLYIGDVKVEQERFEGIERVQQGILDFHKDMIAMRKLVPQWQDCKEFVDELFGKLFTEECYVTEEIKGIFQNDDIYEGVGDYRVWKNYS